MSKLYIVLLNAIIQFLAHMGVLWLQSGLLFLCFCMMIASISEFVQSVRLVPVETDVLFTVKASVIDVSGSLRSWVADSAGGLTSDSAHCNWAGVTCNKNHRVTSLNMSSMGLSGTLSPAVGLLSNLVNLSVAENHFWGALPTEISALSHLSYLNVSNNNFSGSFPDGFSRLELLQTLDAFNNNFSGELPLELSLLNSLKHLHLGGNFFSGKIPPQYGNMLKLEYLALSGNALTGRIPPELGNLKELEQLYLGYYNQLEGGIPVELGRLLKLVRIDVSNSGLSGSIPSALGDLVNLDSLFLQRNGLTGSIPAELGNLRSLKSLDLSCNSLFGVIPEEFKRLQMLELLNLFENSLWGHVPSGLADLPNLQVLKLFSNQLTGALPQHLGSQGKLMIVDVTSNMLHGPIPPRICAKQVLEQLILMNNSFTGTIPAALGRCSTLVRVRLGNNSLRGSIPASLLLLPALNYLEVVGNELTGSIPDQIANNSMLGTLDLSDNHLTGNLPNNIGKMTQLIVLFVARNRLVGAIPGEIGNLLKLTKLDLSKNMFTSAMPSTLGNCLSLTLLDLSHNQLEGHIPIQLSKLFILDSLNLSRNYLTGPIPPMFDTLNALVSLDLSFNNLSGAIPLGGRFSSFNFSSFLGNAGLCGKQVLKDCSHTGVSLTSRIRQQRIIISVCCILVGISCISVAIACCLHRFGGSMEWDLIAFEKLAFTAMDVVDCIKDENMISKGGSAVIYKGLMPSNQVIAIKALSVKANERFAAEIRTLGCIRHRNILRLLGFCSNSEMSLLLLDYMPNGSLESLLHGSLGVLLDWDLRYKIALDIAKGLCYLHHDHSPTIVHRDVKSSNILLDKNYEAHIADFGLAKCFHNVGDSESMSSVVGSYGYIAPEYAYTLRVDEKSDVYSYGVVLLELVTGKRPTEPEYGDYINIVRWIKQKARSRDEVMVIIDPRLLSNKDTLSCAKLQQEIMYLLEVALMCVSNQPECRPTMQNVVRWLTDGCRSGDKDIQNHQEHGGSTKVQV